MPDSLNLSYPIDFSYLLVRSTDLLHELAQLLDYRMFRILIVFPYDIQEELT